MTTRIWGLVAALLLVTAPVSAQQAIGRLTAAEQVAQLDTAGMSTASVTVSGTYSGTVAFEVVGGPGSAAVTVDCATPAAPGSAVNSTTGTGTWVCPVAGMTAIQARMSAYTSGTAAIQLVAAPAAGQTVAAAGGGGSFDGVLLDAAAGDSITDTVNNALRVNIIAGAGSGGTAIADDAAFTPATTSVTPAGALFDDVAPDSVNEGDAGAVRMSANRNLYSTIRDAAGNERGMNVAADGSIAVTVATVPSHAVTNAGVFATQVDGAALTALQLIDNIPVTIGAATGTVGALSIGAVTTSAPTYTTGQTHPLSLTTGGLLRVAIEAGAGSGGTALADDADFTAGTTSFTPFGGFYQSTVTACTDGDTCAAGITTGRAVKVHFVDAAGATQSIASDRAEDSASADGHTGPVTMAIRDDTLDARSGAEGDYEPLHLNANGALWALDVNSAAALTALQAIDDAQTGDSIHYRTSAGATEDEHEVKATAGRLFSVAFTNTNAAVRYWRCSNLTAANTTPGTSAVLLGLAIPGATTGGGFTHTFGPNGAAFSTALTCWFVTGAADTDVAEVAANEIKAIYTYK